jgi:hypothetical protein
MDILALYNTPAAQWQALIQEASQSHNSHLSQDLESYLVFLLIRFTTHALLADSVLALEYLDGLHQPGSMKQEQLRDVGDKCLLFSGFYPEQAEKRHVSPTYFVHLGRSAYSEVATTSYKGLSMLFNELSVHFTDLSNTLNTVRELSRHTEVVFNWKKGPQQNPQLSS